MQRDIKREQSQTLIQEKYKIVHNRTKHRLVVPPVSNRLWLLPCKSRTYAAPCTHTLWKRWLDLCVNRKIFFRVHPDGYNIAMASLDVSIVYTCKVKTSVYIGMPSNDIWSMRHHSQLPISYHTQLSLHRPTLKTLLHIHAVSVYTKNRCWDITFMRIR